MPCENCGHTTSGEMTNRLALVGSRLVQLQTIVPATEKQSLKTPPRSLKTEVQRVEDAKRQLPLLLQENEALLREWSELRVKLGLSAKAPYGVAPFKLTAKSMVG